MNPVVVIHKSVHHGNTRAIAEQIADPLDADTVDVDHVTESSLARTILIGFGSGIYYGRFHRSLRKWVASLPADAGYGRVAFIYSTSGLPFLAPIYHWPLRRALRQRGFRIAGEFACRGHDTWGPLWLIGGLNRKHPDERDLQRAKSFGKQLTQCLQNELSLTSSLEITDVKNKQTA